MAIKVWWNGCIFTQANEGVRSYRLLNIIDDYNRESLGIEVDFSLPSVRVIGTLERVIEWRGIPKQIHKNPHHYCLGLNN